MARLLAELIEKQIAKNLQEFAEVSEKQIQLKLLSGGSVQLKDVKLRSNCLDRLNLPVRLKSGIIGNFHLRMKLHRMFFVVSASAKSRARTRTTTPAHAARRAHPADDP